MDRRALLDVLSLVDPALAENDLIPVLTHYWFTGNEVMAYNDVISISVPFKTKFVGAVKGQILKGILSKYDSKEVEFAEKGDSLTVSTGDPKSSRKSKAKLTTLPDDSFLFSIPDVDPSEFILANRERLFDSVPMCLQALSRRISEPERLGVTVVPLDSNTLALYATDSVTLARAAITTKKEHGLKATVTLSELFCTTLMRFLRQKDLGKFRLYIGKDSVQATFTEGEEGKKKRVTKLFGRLVDDPNPPDFKTVIEKHAPKAFDNMLVAIPDRFSDILDRAHLVINKAISPETRIKISDGALKVDAKSEHGRVSETVEIEGHPDVDVKIDLSRFKECDFTMFTKMLVDERCIVLSRNRDMYQLVAVLGS